MIDHKTEFSLVLASASPRRLELLKQVGKDLMIDYMVDLTKVN